MRAAPPLQLSPHNWAQAAQAAWLRAALERLNIPAATVALIQLLTVVVVVAAALQDRSAQEAREEPAVPAALTAAEAEAALTADRLEQAVAQAARAAMAIQGPVAEPAERPVRLTAAPGSQLPAEEAAAHIATTAA